jgi:hypothetical protein
MTIAQRIDDAQFLWQAGRREGAFLTALLAFAATARRALPTGSDSRAFEELFREQLQSGTSVTFRGEPTPMSRLFYKWLRCELVHAGGLPVGLTFDDDDSHGLFTLTLSDDYPISISSVYYHSLVLSVVAHPKNADVFPDQQGAVDALLEQHRRAGQRVIGVVPRRNRSAPAATPPAERAPATGILRKS